MSEKITLTYEEKERLKNAIPYIKDEKWDEVFSSIANHAYHDSGNAPLHILNFLKENGIDLLHKITHFCNLAFYRCNELEQIEIPDNITRIDSDTFKECEKLEMVKIGNGVKSIDNYAFYSCTALKNVNIGNSVKWIMSEAFYNCNSLPIITIPNNVIWIESNVFGECSSLETIYYDGSKDDWEENVLRMNHWKGSSPATLKFKK